MRIIGQNPKVINNFDVLFVNNLLITFSGLLITAENPHLLPPKSYQQLGVNKFSNGKFFLFEENMYSSSVHFSLISTPYPLSTESFILLGTLRLAFSFLV